MLYLELTPISLPYCKMPPQWSLHLWPSIVALSFFNRSQNNDSFFSHKSFAPGGPLVAQIVKNVPAMWEIWVRFLGWEDPLEEDTATNSSILAWRIPWTRKSSGIQSMGSQRVGHDWVTTLSLSPHIFYCTLTLQIDIFFDHGIILFLYQINKRTGFPDGSVVKNPPANTGETGSIPGLERSPGEENGNQLQYSCLENPMDRGAWQATVHGLARVGHDLMTKPPPSNLIKLLRFFFSFFFLSHTFHCCYKPLPIRWAFAVLGSFHFIYLFFPFSS